MVRHSSPQGYDSSSRTQLSEPTALAVYGTLAPGEANHWVVRGIKGIWSEGAVQGYTFEITWGPVEGYPGFIADPDGNAVTVQVLESEELDKHWHTIDDFEGDGYERRVLPVAMADGRTIDAWIYIALTDT